MKHQYYTMIFVGVALAILIVLLVIFRPGKDDVLGPDDFTYHPAVVTDVDIAVLESFPVQVRANVSGNLGDGCTELGDITATREGNHFDVDVMTKRPKDLACTQVLTSFNESISLDVLDLLAGDYTVDINGFEASFRLDVNNTVQYEGGK